MTAAPADKIVPVGQSNVILIQPVGPEASVILIPGGNGKIFKNNKLQDNQLMRTRPKYAERGLAVMVVDFDTNLASAVEKMRTIKEPVTVVATSNGTRRAAHGIADAGNAAGVPDALVLTSGMLTPESGSGGDPDNKPYENVKDILGSREALPKKTLVIHHRKDECEDTRPAGVDPFIEWAGDKARVYWLSAGSPKKDPKRPNWKPGRCGAFHYHGFYGLDDTVVSLAGGVAFRHLATPLPATVVGKWTFREEPGKDQPTVFEVTKDGTVKPEGRSTWGRGHIVSYSDNEIKIEIASIPDKMIIWWDPKTAIGHNGHKLYFVESTFFPLTNEPGPYDVSVRRN